MNEETLSSFWRRRRSQDRPIALRDLQLELTYMARLILKDQNVNIAWHQNLVDKSNPSAKTLILDSTPIEDIPTGQAVPDERVDTLVGDTVFRAHLEALERDAVYGAATRVLNASLASDIKREARILAGLKHLKAYNNSLDSSPAVRDYVSVSRDWKKEHIKELAAELVQRCEAEQVSFQDALDLWALFLIYDIDLSSNLNPDVLKALSAAASASYKIVTNDRLNFSGLTRDVKAMAMAFSGFKDKKDMEPPPAPAQGEEEEEGESGDSPDATEGSGDDSPDGTDKENEGEPPEGGPGDEQTGDNSSQDEESEASDDGTPSDDSADQEPTDTDSPPEDEDRDGAEGEDAEDSERDGSDSSDDRDSGSSDEEDDFEGDEEEDGEAESGNDVSDDSLPEYGGETEMAPSQPSPLDRIREQAEQNPMVDLIDQIDSLSDEQADEIRQSIEFAREDITDEVETLEQQGGFYGGAGGTQIIWEKAQFDLALENKLRGEAFRQASGITQILARFKRLRSRVEHGTTDGYKLDARRVGRIAYGNEHVFKKRSVIDKLDMCLVLLLDSSSSISDPQWDLIMKTAASFVQALAYRDDVELIVASYSSQSDYNPRTWISSRYNGVARHYDKRMGHLAATRKYSGGTTSAMGLAAIRESVFKRLNVRKRDKIVIHLTDGMPDDSAAVTQQVQLNREAHIETYCILVEDERMAYFRNLYNRASNDDVNFRAMYGDKFQKLEGYNKLLACLTELFGKITEVR